jgi:hypothetical protein
MTSYWLHSHMTTWSRCAYTHYSTTHDNGLLIVIKGEHCGKYVCRIHHQYENNNCQSAIMQLVVVDREETGANVLMGEEIKLMPEYLVQSFKTDDEKQLNVNLMTAQRSQAHHGS